jgi:hypothetical protein
MAFFEIRWNYSPLKEKAVLLPDGLFICFCRYAPHRLRVAPGRERGRTLLSGLAACLGSPSFDFIAARQLLML